MRRLARHALTAVSALSLLLCLAVCVLWVRSHWRSDRVRWDSAGGAWHARSQIGHVYVASLGRGPATPRSDVQWAARDASADLNPSVQLNTLAAHRGVEAFHVIRGTVTPPGETGAVRVVIVGGSYVVLLAAAGVPPLLHVLLLARRSPLRRRQALAALPWLATSAAALLLYREVIDSPRFPFDVRATAGLTLFASPVLAFVAGWAWRGRSYPRRKVYYVIGYYVALAAAVLSQLEVVAGAFWIAGPLVALGLLVHSADPVVPGLCRACGYDLRASPERCPECGTIPSPDPGAERIDTGAS